MKAFRNLGEFIAHFGQAKLARAMGVDRSTVTLWKQGKTRPKPDHAQHLVDLSNGRLDLETVYRVGGAR